MTQKVYYFLVGDAFITENSSLQRECYSKTIHFYYFDSSTSRVDNIHLQITRDQALALKDSIENLLSSDDGVSK